MVVRLRFTAVAAALLLDIFSRASAHSDDGHGHSNMAMAMGASMVSSLNSSMSYSMSAPRESYFTHPSLSGYMVAHIVLMTIASLFILPLSEFTS